MRKVCDLYGVEKADVEGDALAATPGPSTLEDVRAWVKEHPTARFYVWSAFLEGNSFEPLTFEEALDKARLRKASHEDDSGARIVLTCGSFPSVYMRRPKSTVEEWKTSELPEQVFPWGGFNTGGTE
jgi:hypothetical protein